MKKTAKQLAAELGVSATTVSLALRGSGNISGATRERVIAAAKAAGMSVPDTEGPKNVYTAQRDYAMICSGYVERNPLMPYPNPFILSMIRDMGIESAKRNARLMPVFTTAIQSSTPFDGYFFYLSGYTPPAPKMIQKPSVYIDAEPIDENSVMFDQEGSMKKLAALICEKGYKRPFFIHFENIHPKFGYSFAFLRQLLFESGVALGSITYNEDKVIPSDDVDGQWKKMREYAGIISGQSAESRPDAIICNNDCLADMLQLSLKEYGIASGAIDAPHSIPLFGFDDVPYIPGAEPFTTFHTDTGILSDAAHRLMEQLLLGEPPYKQHLRIEAEMIIR